MSEAIQERHMRKTDDFVYRIVKLWPLAVAIVGAIVTIKVLALRVDVHEKRINVHAKRLHKVELDAAVARVNTDALVSNLLDKETQRRLRGQVSTLTTYFLKANEEIEEGP